jgi:hypothetical protein
MQKRVQARVASRGAEGNIFAILEVVRQALRKANCITEYNDLRDDVLSSPSYEAAITRIRQTVDLIDTDKQI